MEVTENIFIAKEIHVTQVQLTPCCRSSVSPGNIDNAQFGELGGGETEILSDILATFLESWNYSKINFFKKINFLLTLRTKENKKQNHLLIQSFYFLMLPPHPIYNLPHGLIPWLPGQAPRLGKPWLGLGWAMLSEGQAKGLGFFCEWSWYINVV